MVFPRPDPKMLDDIARVAGGAVNIFSGIQDQIRNDVRARVEEMAANLDLVPRDELDRALGMLEKLRKDMATLEARLDALDGKKSKKEAKPKAAKPKTAKKTGAKTVKKAGKKK